MSSTMKPTNNSIMCVGILDELKVYHMLKTAVAIIYCSRH